MKRNLFAMLLAVVMIAAVIFVAAPATKADAAVTTISAADNATIKIENDGEYVIDIFGVKDVTVDVTAGNAKISFVDTKFMTGNWDLTGESAGSVTVTGYTVPAYCQYGDYKYLAVPGENGTYSFHPFNLTITRYGVNVKQNGICVQASYIADGVVKELIEDYGLTNVTAEESASGKTQFPIPNGKYGVHAYYVLTGSLSAEKVNQTRELKAYINFKGYERIESNQEADVTPSRVLGLVNSEYPTYENGSRSKELADMLYENNEHLRQYLPALKPAEPVVETTVKVTISDYASANGWQNETKYSELVMDDNITVTASAKNNNGKYYTNGNNWRMYQGDSGTITISAADGSIISVKITYTSSNSGVLIADGTQVQSGTVYSVNAQSVTLAVGNTGSATNGQARITAIEVTYSSAPPCEHNYEITSETPATCTENGVKVETCSKCEKTKKTVIEATGHKFGADGKCTNNNCDETQSTATVVLEITKSNFNSTSYAANNNTQTVNGYSFTSNQVMLQSSAMQWQKSKGYITIASNSFSKLEMKVKSGTFTVTVGGKAVSGTTSNGVTTYNLTGLTGQIKIAVGSATGSTEYLKFYS